MSPTENELRAALHDGEGDGPDVGSIIAAGRRLRARRTRLLTTAAAVVVVAGVATGGSLLTGNSAGSEKSNNAAGGTAGGSSYGSSPGHAADALRGSASEKAAGGAEAPNPAAPAAHPACPTAPPAYARPNPGGAAKLFTRPVASAVVCAYASFGATASTAPEPLRLTGGPASELADSLETTTPERYSGMCPDYRSADQRTLVITGYDGDGAPVGTVVTTVGAPSCAVVVYSERTQRYGWMPPSDLAAVLDQAQPAGGRSHGPVLQQSTSPSR